MIPRFRKFLQSPAFDDPEKARRAQNIRMILLGTLLAVCAWAAYVLLFQITQAVTAVIILSILLGLLLLLQRGFVAASGMLLSFLLWAALLGAMIAFGGIRNSGFAVIVVVVVIAELTLGVRAGVTYAFLSLLAGVGLVIAENQGLLPPYAHETHTTIFVSHLLTISATTLLLSLALRNLAAATRRAVENEQAQKEINVKLEESRASLEQHSAALEKRNLSLQTIAEFSGFIGKVRDENEFLERAGGLIAAQLGYAHVRVFLLDWRGENAILRASSTPAGALPVESPIQLRAARGEAAFHFAEETPLKFQAGRESYWLSAPRPIDGMQTAAAFPLASGEQLFGLLDIQSAAPAIAAEERAVLQTIADQMAVALDNLRLLARLQDQVREIGQLAGQSAQQAWTRVAAGAPVGYLYDRIRVLPADEPLPAEVAGQLRGGKALAYVTAGAKKASRLAAPILVRGQLIGVIGCEENDPGHAWDRDAIFMLETIASQVGLALENTRLIADAQQRARRERIVSEVSGRIRETLDMDTILQTAVQEMKQTLGLEQAEVRLQLAPPKPAARKRSKKD
jgi:GAF domain-containing protein